MATRYLWDTGGPDAGGGGGDGDGQNLTDTQHPTVHLKLLLLEINMGSFVTYVKKNDCRKKTSPFNHAEPLISLGPLKSRFPKAQDPNQSDLLTHKSP